MRTTTERTQTPWTFDTGLHVYGFEAREPVAGERELGAACIVDLPHICTATTHANAAYITAAVNACASLGLTADELNAGALAKLVELVELSKVIAPHLEAEMMPPVAVVNRLRDALAPFTKGE